MQGLTVCSPKKLSFIKEDNHGIKSGALYVDRLNPLGYNHSDRVYVYKVDVKPFFQDRQEDQLFINKIALAISAQNFDPSIDWINSNCLKPKQSKARRGISTIFSDAKELYSDSEIDCVLNFVIQWATSWDSIEWIYNTILTSGFSGLIAYKTNIEIEKFKSRKRIRKLRAQFSKLQSSNVTLDTINSHAIETIKNNNLYNYAKSISSDEYHKPFLIKTSGFNQCFVVDSTYYSVVTVTKSNETTSNYRVYVFGCDDSSYSSYFMNLDEAIETAEWLSRISTVVNFGHMKAMGFEFTN